MSDTNREDLDMAIKQGSSGESTDSDITCVICADLVNNAHRSNCCHSLYCLECIKKWITRGNSNSGSNTCPNCRAAISEDTLVADVTIDQTSAVVIRCCPHKEQYGCPFTGDRAAVHLHKDECLIKHQEIELASMFKQIREGSEEDRITAATGLHGLLKPNPELRHLLVRLDGIRTLISCLGQGPEEAQYQANLCLDLLAYDEESKAMMVEGGLAAPLANLVATAGIKVLPNAMLLLSKCVIFNFANQTTFGAAGVIPHLVRHVRSDVEDVQVNAAGALWNIARKNTVNQLQIATLGALPPLIRLALSGVTINATGALWNIISVSDPDECLKISDTHILRLLVQAYDNSDTTTDGTECGDADGNGRGNGNGNGNGVAQDVRIWIASALDTLLTINPKNIDGVVEVGALALITDLQPTDSDNLLEHIVSVLSRALKASPGCRTEINAVKLVPRLITLLARRLSTVTPINRDMVHPSEGALQVIRALCDANPEAQDLFVNNAGLPKLMTILGATVAADSTTTAATIESCQYEAMALLEYLTRVHAATTRELLGSVGLCILLAALDNHYTSITLLAAPTLRCIVDAIHNMCVQQPARCVAALLVRSTVWSVEPRCGVDAVVHLAGSEGVSEEVRESCDALLRTLAHSGEACRQVMRAAGVGSSADIGYSGEGEW